MSPFLLLVLICAESEGSSPLEGVTCGQASVFYALDRLDTPVPLEEVQKVLPEGPDSMNSFADLITALAYFGYPHAVGFELNAQQLLQVRGPVIANVLVRGERAETFEHFFVVVPVGTRLLVLDSVHHPFWTDAEEFTEGKTVRVLVPSPANQMGSLQHQGWLTIFVLVFSSTLLCAGVVAGFVVVRARGWWLPWKTSETLATHAP